MKLHATKYIRLLQVSFLHVYIKMEYPAPCPALVHIRPSEQGRNFLPLDLQRSICQQIAGSSILLFHLQSILLVRHQNPQFSRVVCTLCTCKLELHKLVTMPRIICNPHYHLATCNSMQCTTSTLFQIRLVYIKEAIVGASLSEPHTSVTSLRTCVCMYVCMYVCLDRPLTENFNFK